MLTSPSGKTYIGQTTRPIYKRLEEHETGKNGCSAIYNAIKKYGWGDFEKDWYECPDEDLNKHEELMIEVIGTLAPGGYNLREGGGSTGKMSEESKQRMSESKTGEKHPMWGKPKNEGTRQKISEAKLGHDVSEETRQKISESLLGEKNHNHGKPKSKETRQKLSDSKKGEKNYKSKRVYQYALDGTFIDSFGSGGEAGRHFKKSGANISACACGKYKTAYNFKWSYMLDIFI